MTERALKPGWKVWRFDQIATSVAERVEPGDTNAEYYVGLEHLDSDSLKIRRWGKPSDVEATKLLFRKGDIIFGRRRAYQRKLSVAEFDGICSAHAMVLRPKTDVVLSEFLPFFMQSNLFMQRALDISVGSLSPTINWRTLAKQEFALPPLAEQRRIAEVLIAADEVINVYAESLNSAYTLRSAIRKTEFDPMRHKSSPLRDLCNDGTGIRIGPFGSQLHQSDYVDVGIPVVMPANMVDEKIDISEIAQIPEWKAQELARHRIKSGDILLPRRGELDRRAYVEAQNEGWLCGTGSIRIRLDSAISSKAVFHSLASSHSVRWLTGNAVGTTMPNLNSKIIGRIPVSLPSEERQVIVIERLDELQRQIKNLNDRLMRAKRIKAVLINQVLGDDNDL